MILALLLACSPPGSPDTPVANTAGSDPVAPDDTNPPTAPTDSDADDTAPPADAPPADADGEDLGAAPDGASLLFDPTTVLEFTLTVSDAGIAALRADPDAWVEGALEFQGATWSPIGVRIKGSASFQPIDEKPALKLELDEYSPALRFFGLESITLNNEVWDPTMMAENMAYRSFRAAGSPAPRTGYAAVTLNDRYLGLYTILESMDDDFIDATWPGSEGGLWEMTRSCDFTGACTCFDPQASGSRYDPDGITRGCEAVSEGTLEAIQDAFDYDALLAFLAVERALNHPDSYSYNLNNFFVYHDPDTDRLSLSPWGADSTFIYVYPPSAPNPDCEPIYLDVMASWPVGWLGAFCQSDAGCKADLKAKMLDVADWIESSDLVGEMEAARDLLDPYAPLETNVNWTVADRDARVACFLTWTAQRPDELRGLLGGR